MAATEATTGTANISPPNRWHPSSLCPCISAQFIVTAWLARGHGGVGFGVVIPDPDTLLHLARELPVASPQIVAGGVVAGAVGPGAPLDARRPLAPHRLVHPQPRWR